MLNSNIATISQKIYLNSLHIMCTLSRNGMAWNGYRLGCMVLRGGKLGCMFIVLMAGKAEQRNDHL